MNLKRISKKNKNYYLKKINKFLLQKYDLINNNKVSIFELIVVDLKCRSSIDEDIIFKNNLIFLERITGQKALGFGEFKFIGSLKLFFFSGKVTLRKKILINFLLFLFVCCLSIYYKRNGRFVENAKGKRYTLSIVDFNIFPNFNFMNVIGTMLIKFIGNQENIDLKLDEALKLIKIK